MARYFAKGRECTGRCGRTQGTSPSGFDDRGFNADWMCPSCVSLGRTPDPLTLAKYRSQEAWKNHGPDSAEYAAAFAEYQRLR